jgi:hypothetical protein
MRSAIRTSIAGVAGAALAVTLLCPAPGSAQDAEADKEATLKRIAGFAELIEGAESDIQKKQWEHRFLLSLVLLVGILGAASAAVQKFQGSRARLCTLAMGVVISAATFVTNTLFSDDHRTLRRNIDRARYEQKLGAVEAKSASLSQSVLALQQTERQVQARYAAILASLGSESGREASLGLASAWAQAPAPARSEECARWASAGLCFSGIGRSAWPEQARQNALSVAVEMAARHVARQAAQMRGDRRAPEAYREYVERFGRVQDIYPSQELRKGRELAYVAIVTLNPRFVDAKVLAASVPEPRPIASGDFVLIRSAGGEPWLRIEGQSVLADRGPDGASTWVFGKRSGARGPLQTGDQVVLRGIWGDPYVAVEPDGRLTAFKGPSEATVFRLDKRAGSGGDLLREGDAFTLAEQRSGRLVRADRPVVTLGGPADAGASRFASVLVPRPGGKF